MCYFLNFPISCWNSLWLNVYLKKKNNRHFSFMGANPSSYLCPWDGVVFLVIVFKHVNKIDFSSKNLIELEKNTCKILWLCIIILNTNNLCTSRIHLYEVSYPFYLQRRQRKGYIDPDFISSVTACSQARTCSILMRPSAGWRDFRVAQGDKMRDLGAKKREKIAKSRPKITSALVLMGSGTPIPVW